jgi:hypothetical protein
VKKDLGDKGDGKGSHKLDELERDNPLRKVHFSDCSHDISGKVRPYM